MPAIVVAFFAGPLSDRYSRKPFVLLSIGGYVVLNAIFLINAYWFYELKVQVRQHKNSMKFQAEFLLFEFQAQFLLFEFQAQFLLFEF